MIYITGDTHGDFRRIAEFCSRIETTKEDILIILGDAGINYYGGERDRKLKFALSELPITFFCIHGNHEQRPATIPSYEEMIWHGGSVYMEAEFPNLFFAKDSEIFDFDGRKCIVIGGAYSVDKEYRLSRGTGWWADEQPSDEIKSYVESQLEKEDWAIDVVLSHTTPLKYEPIEMFLSGIKQSGVDKSTEGWLDRIEDRLDYGQWYCGHYHTNKNVNKMVFQFEEIQMWSVILLV